MARNDLVEGTDGDDIIDSAYSGDPEGNAVNDLGKAYLVSSAYTPNAIQRPLFATSDGAN